MAVFTILYGNYYPPHGEFELICIRKFTRRTRVNFTQQYGKNRQRCQKHTFFYAVWQLLLYFCREFPSKILSVCAPVHFTVWHSKNYIFVRITGMNTKTYGVLQYILRCDFYIQPDEKALCSIFGHIPPPHEMWLVVLVRN